MGPGDECGEKTNAGSTGTSLNRTDANDECPSQRCTTSEQWQPGVFTNPTSVPRNGGKSALKPTMGHRKKVRLKVFHPKEE